MDTRKNRQVILHKRKKTQRNKTYLNMVLVKYQIRDTLQDMSLKARCPSRTAWPPMDTLQSGVPPANLTHYTLKLVL